MIKISRSKTIVKFCQLCIKYEFIHHFTGKPFFKNGPVKQQISEGHAVEFHCEVNHDSNEKKETLTQWIYNRKPMNECSFFEDIHFENGFSVLKINKTKKVHIGTYGCNVTNAYGYIYKEGYLYVEEGIKLNNRYIRVFLVIHFNLT